jgi:hypothetical protein
MMSPAIDVNNDLVAATARGAVVSEFRTSIVDSIRRHVARIWFRSGATKLCRRTISNGCAAARDG